MTQWQWSVFCALIRIVMSMTSHAEWNHKFDTDEQFRRDSLLLKEALSPERNRG